MKGQSPPSSSSAAAEIEGHEDLLYEILILLPPKTLFKFKAVSPRWRSLISAPTFCHRHALHHHRRDTQHSLLIQSKEGQNFLVSSFTNPRLFPRRFRLDASSVKVEQSCNGLLLLRVATNSDLYRLRFYVFNPTTSEMKNLAPLPRDAEDIESLYLIFDPSLSPHYKVFCIVGAIYIYSSETRRWKRTRHSIEETDTSFDDGVYFNGGVYFLPLDYAFRLSTIVVRGDGHVSVVPYLRPPRPYYYYVNGDEHYAIESNGFVFWVTLYWNIAGDFVRVHEMKEIESGWSKKCGMNGLHSVLSACGGKYRGAMKLISVIKDEDLWLLLLVNGKIVRYRVSDGVFDIVVDYSSEEFVQERKEWNHVGDAHHFIHTLAPVF